MKRFCVLAELSVLAYIVAGSAIFDENKSTEILQDSGDLKASIVENSGDLQYGRFLDIGQGEQEEFLREYDGETAGPAQSSHGDGDDESAVDKSESGEIREGEEAAYEEGDKPEAEVEVEVEDKPEADAEDEMSGMVEDNTSGEQEDIAHGEADDNGNNESQNSDLESQNYPEVQDDDLQLHGETQDEHTEQGEVAESESGTDPTSSSPTDVAQGSTNQGESDETSTQLHGGEDKCSESTEAESVDWPDAWCEKECRETYLLYEGCKKQEELVGESCVCSAHFRYKVNKCQADGCEHYYHKSPKWQELMEQYVAECKDKGDDFVDY